MTPVIPFLQTARNKYSRYSKHILGFRHFADGGDGLKPVQRRVVWAMHRMGAKDKNRKTKTSKVAGDCFAAGTPVSTPKGLVAIESLVVGDEVRTSQGTSVVDRVFINEPSPMLRIDLSNRRFIVCTHDQEVKVRVGARFFWKRAHLLDANDEVVVECV